MAGDVGERPVEILRPEGMADQEWGQADRHHPGGLGAVLVEPVELVDHHAVELPGAAAAVDENRDVVDLDRVGGRDQRARFGAHGVGLLVVYPVADIVVAGLGQQIGRVAGLRQRRAEPAARPAPGGLGDGCRDVFDQRRALAVADAHAEAALLEERLVILLRLVFAHRSLPAVGRALSSSGAARPSSAMAVASASRQGVIWRKNKGGSAWPRHRSRISKPP